MAGDFGGTQGSPPSPFSLRVESSAQAKSSISWSLLAEPSGSKLVFHAESASTCPTSIILVTLIWPPEPKRLPQAPPQCWTHPTENASACSTHSVVGDIWKPTSIPSAF